MFLRLSIRETVSGVRMSATRFPQFCGLMLFFWLSVLPSVGRGQSDRLITAADTSSPRDTLRSFIEGCNAIYDIVEQDKYLDPRSPEHASIAFRIMDCV